MTRDCARLYAVSDLHLNHEDNRQALLEIAARPDDWLILAGDVGETCAHLELALEVLSPRFRQIVWVPGNHDLWSVPENGARLRGEAKYQRLVEICRSYGALTPEDPYPVVTVGGRQVRVAPLFCLYDYSFRPSDVAFEEAVAWAKAGGVMCSDEVLLHADPYPSVVEWCQARCALTEQRLRLCAEGPPLVLISHFPLRQSVVWLPRIPRFSIWCGTRRTEDWHLRFNACVVVSGHLHMRGTQFCHGVRFEEVSLGYPRQWSGYTTVGACVREILPGDTEAEQRRDRVS